MLARYLRQTMRPARVRYAIHTRDMMPSLMFGLKSLGRMEGLPWLLRQMIHPPRGVAPAHWGEAGQQADFTIDALADLINTGHPDALTALLDHLHGEVGFPPPIHNPPGGTLDWWLAKLHAMHAQRNVATQEPRHPLRLYTPHNLAHLTPEFISDDAEFMHDYPHIASLHPAEGGPGLAGLHDAYDLAQMEGGTAGGEHGLRLPAHTMLFNLMRSLHSRMTESSGLQPQQVGG